MPNADLHIVGSRNTRYRLILVSAVIIALVFAWFAVRRQIGDMIADLTSPNDPVAPMMADIAYGMAPSDPITMWLKATLEKNVFAGKKTDSAVMMFEETVKLSPDDYRWWIELGFAYEQSEMPARAEAAFKHSIALAPAYTLPHWQLGNYYLRLGRSEEAFGELRKATENNYTYREQVFSLAWDYFDKDPAKVEQLAADRPDVHASLAWFYAQRGRAADALRIWNLLNDTQKMEYPQISRNITQGLYDRRFFPEALEFARQLGIDPDARPETVTNGSFEKPVGNAEDTKFGWIVVRNDGRIDIAADTAVRHEGTKSLRVVFKNYNKPELYNIFQTIVVEPGNEYKLSFWLRTENLRSGGMPQLQVVNGNDDKIITLSAPYPAGTNDWQEIVVDFTAPANCNGIFIRTARGFCGNDCPIVGTFWYDDFMISRR